MFLSDEEPADMDATPYTTVDGKRKQRFPQPTRMPPCKSRIPLLFQKQNLKLTSLLAATIKRRGSCILLTCNDSSNE
jgi:hypothetical protein